MLKTETSITVAISTAGLVYGIYSVMLPNVAEARTSDVDDDDLRSAENVATWTALGAVLVIFAMTKDPLPFIAGNTMIASMSWIHRYARVVDPAVGRIRTGSANRYITEDELITADRGANAAA